MTKPAWRVADEVWFKENPGRSHRLRPAPGEDHRKWGQPCDWAVVRQVTPRCLTRILIDFRGGEPPPDSEGTAREIFEQVLQPPPGGWRE
jgi:hypothetical protein